MLSIEWESATDKSDAIIDDFAGDSRDMLVDVITEALESAVNRSLVFPHSLS